MKITVEFESIAEFDDFRKWEAEKKGIPIEDLPIEDLPIEDLPLAFALSIRSRNCLKSANIRTIGQAIAMGDRQLLRVPKLGRVCLDEIWLAWEGIKKSRSTEKIDTAPPNLG